MIRSEPTTPAHATDDAHAPVLRDRAGVTALAALILLGTLVAVTTSVGGASSVDRAGVRTLFEEAPVRLRIAAAVIATAVRDLGLADADQRFDAEAELTLLVETACGDLDPIRVATVVDLRCATPPATRLAHAVLAIPPPTI